MVIRLSEQERGGEKLRSWEGMGRRFVMSEMSDGAMGFFWLGIRGVNGVGL